PSNEVEAIVETGSSTEENEITNIDRLIGNYPNPFNPETTISFNIQETNDVLLEIFNIKGQKIKTLINSALPAGNHKVVWNGTDENDLQVSSGIYFYKLRSTGFEQIKKMILMK
ncbi:MAG: T9SS type A sorting domain-containing protein, partial [Candidatus Cloacimonadota bacterium]|nr:T9SS type A sorting domain-containing protein [Candidatus Cloacimonadota bacterium]